MKSFQFKADSLQTWSEDNVDQSLIELIIKGKEKGFQKRFTPSHGSIYLDDKIIDPSELHIHFVKSFPDEQGGQNHAICYYRLETKQGVRGYLVSATGLNGTFDVTKLFAPLRENTPLRPSI